VPSLLPDAVMLPTAAIVPQRFVGDRWHYPKLAVGTAEFSYPFSWSYRRVSRPGGLSLQPHDSTAHLC
jgi:hypothetical protein